MTESQGQEESKKCCSGSKCSSGNSRCGSKTIMAIVLILLGWICGYLMGSGGCGGKYLSCFKAAGSALSCPLTGTPQAPAAK